MGDWLDQLWEDTQGRLKQLLGGIQGEIEFGSDAGDGVRGEITIGQRPGISWPVAFGVLLFLVVVFIATRGD